MKLIQLPPIAPPRLGLDKTKHCRYHRSHGHNTGDCWALKDKMEKLIQVGYLAQFCEGFVAGQNQSHRYGWWVALTSSIWQHRNQLVFEGNHFQPSKVMDDALFLKWSWLKTREKNFSISFNALLTLWNILVNMGWVYLSYVVGWIYLSYVVRLLLGSYLCWKATH